MIRVFVCSVLSLVVRGSTYTGALQARGTFINIDDDGLQKRCTSGCSPVFVKDGPVAGHRG